MYKYFYISKHYKFESSIESSHEIILNDLLYVTVTRKKCNINPQSIKTQLYSTLKE